MCYPAAASPLLRVGTTGDQPDGLRGERPAGDAPPNYARPKGKFHARPARPVNAGGRGR